MNTLVDIVIDIISLPFTLLSRVSSSEEIFNTDYIIRLCEQLDLTQYQAEFLAAQALLETGGKSKGNNLFNLTAGSYWTGQIINRGDTDGEGKPITQNFRAYSSFIECISDYLRFISTERYKKAKALFMENNPEFIRELGLAGFYTLNPDIYYSRFQKCWHEVAR